ncbi:MAG: flagellar biosynthesis protein FlhB [Asticcacaulis sp.]
MAEEADGADKTEQASERKLQQAREKGDVGKSGDLPQAMSLIGACGVVAIMGPSICNKLALNLMPFLARPDEISASLAGDGGMGIAHIVVMDMLPILLMVLGASIFFGVAGNVLQTGLMFTPSKLAPKLDKLNPMAGFKRLFGVDALIAFGKTIIKLSITGVIVWLVVKNRLTDIVALAGASPVLILPYVHEAAIALAMAVCIFLFVAGVADFALQKFRFLQRMKMSKQEQKDEHKQTDGDPHIKAKLRQLRMEKGRRRMMQNVATATVVVTNPTHYAVALHFEMGEMMAPVCVAKGMDAVALRIRAEAGKHDVPIVEDPPLARALYASMDIDDVIPEQHFAAVAKLISFVMSKKKSPF